MNNMRRGFTMIELIFVIVIIGILAGVAVPKLNVTRDNAIVSKGVQEVQQAISEIGAYYTAHGAIPIEYQAPVWKKITNVKLTPVGNSDRAAYTVNDSYCVYIDATKDGNVTLDIHTLVDPKKHLCIKLREALSKSGIVPLKAKKTYLFGGSTIKY